MFLRHSVANEQKQGKTFVNVELASCKKYFFATMQTVFSSSIKILKIRDRLPTVVRQKVWWAYCTFQTVGKNRNIVILIFNSFKFVKHKIKLKIIKNTYLNALRWYNEMPQQRNINSTKNK